MALGEVSSLLVSSGLRGFGIARLRDCYTWGDSVQAMLALLQYILATCIHNNASNVNT
jgi:hypothetical protein